MKTSRSYLVLILVLLGLTGFAASGFSQNEKPDKKSRKEARKAELAANFRVIDSLLMTGEYVLEANYLQGKYGDRVPVSSTLNFIRVNREKGVLQTGSDLRQGYNGVGGVTAEGSITDYKIERNEKNLSHSVRFNLMTNLGTFNILLNVTADNYANAMITGTTSGRLTWDGRLVPLGSSRVFKGHNTI
jgi:hypothetical protein